jgi:hypothetical protein
MVSEKYDRYERLRERRLTLDDCPACERPMTHLLTVGGGPDAPGGGTFLFCERCRDLWVRAEGGRRNVSSRHAFVLALEVLRLQAELAEVRSGARAAEPEPPPAAPPPPRRREPRGPPPGVPKNIGEAAEWARERAAREALEAQDGTHRRDGA